MDLQFKKKYRDRDELLSYLNDCNQHTLKEACLITDVGGTSSFSERREDQTSFDFAITSTPNTKKGPLTRKSNGSGKLEILKVDKNLDNIENTPRTAAKILAMVECKRKEVGVPVLLVSLLLELFKCTKVFY